MTDRSPSGGSNQRPQYTGTGPRRLSYASVASGATPQNVPYPTRSGAFSHLQNASPSDTFTTQHHQDHRYQRRQSGMEQELSSSPGYWRKSPPLPSYSRKFANIPGFGPGAMPNNTFFIPSYLKHSRYVAKLEAAHKAKVKRERELPSASSSNPPSLSTSASNVNIQKIAPSHRGMTYEVIESNPPKEDEQLLPLPSKWNALDRYPGLDVTSDGLDLRYSGSASKADIEAASVRADYPMPPACGIYYYEVEIKQKGKDSAIAIGFATAKASLERLPGWEEHSWGYHGDDGKLFSGEHSGRSSGQPFTAGDVIGCGLNFHTGQAFFTKNGTDLGVCFRDLKNVRPFPCVGMKKYPGALVTVNFGQKPFVFDIQDKILSERISVNNEIAKAKVSSLRPPLDENSIIQELVAQFLAHDGYVDTAKAFADEVQGEKRSLNNMQALPTITETIQNDTEAFYRQQIRKAILSGNIDDALKVTSERFPNVLSQSPQIVFRLKCRKWVELLSKATDLNTKKSLSQKMRKPSNGYMRGSAVMDDFAQDMELDDQVNGSGQSNGVSKPEEPDSHSQYNQLIVDYMDYGQELQREYRDVEDREFSQTLLDIFSLVAYDDPRESVHGHLLDPSGRVAVAEELNSAILVSLGRQPSAALEKVYKQTEALIDVLSEDGGAAAFVNLQSQFGSARAQ